MSNDVFQQIQFWKELKENNFKMVLSIEDLQPGMLVTDNEKAAYGVGSIDRIKDNLVFVWYDEIDSMIHYQEDEIKFLTPIGHG